MQIFLWLVKVILVAMLCIAGLFIGNYFMVPNWLVSDFHGGVIVGWGVVLSVLLMGGVTWFLVGFKRQGIKGSIAAALASLLVAGFVGYDAAEEWFKEDRAVQGLTVAWFNPFSELKIDGKFAPDSAIAKYLVERDEKRVTSDKTQTYENLLAEKDYFSHGQLVLASQAASNAKEYDELRFKAGIHPSRLSLTQVDDQRPTILASAHFAMPSLGVPTLLGENSRLKPPAFAVTPDYDTALNALFINAYVASTPSKNDREVFDRALQLACKEGHYTCRFTNKSADFPLLLMTEKRMSYFNFSALNDGRDKEILQALAQLATSAGYTSEQIEETIKKINAVDFLRTMVQIPEPAQAADSAASSTSDARIKDSELKIATEYLTPRARAAQQMLQSHWTGSVELTTLTQYWKAYESAPSDGKKALQLLAMYIAMFKLRG